MNILSRLPKTTIGTAKRVGRGPGSGKGRHTTGRGQKGQKARTKIHPAFMGTKVKKSLLQRLPLLRGKGCFKPLKSTPLIIKLDQLSKLEPNTKVSRENVAELKLVTKKITPATRLKVVATGKITTPIEISLPTTAAAKEQIEAAGGKVIA